MYIYIYPATEATLNHPSRLCLLLPLYYNYIYIYNYIS